MHESGAPLSAWKVPAAQFVQLLMRGPAYFPAGQPEQVEAPASENLPAEQAEQLSTRFPALAMYMPPAQFAQVAEKGIEVNVPAGQALHLGPAAAAKVPGSHPVHCFEPATDDDPAAQPLHPAEAEEDSYLPASQLKQLADPVALWYVPAEQPMQAMAPFAEYWPWVQFAQAVADAVLVNLPALQAGQTLALAAE